MESDFSTLLRTYRNLENTPIVTFSSARILEIAEAAARAAGTYLLQKLGSARVASQKALNDDLLDADLEAERLLFTHLQKETPGLGILSEEQASQETGKHYWIVDPLDGSANFQHGSPLFAIAIALVLDQITRGSAIYLPAQDEMFTAIQHQGAFLNGKRISVSSTRTVEQTIAHIGDFSKGNNIQQIYERVKDTQLLIAHTRRVRMIGTAAMDLAYLACGRADVLVNYATDPWDIEAGKLLLLEAGGQVSTRRYPDRVMAIYSNGIVHQDVENLLS